MAELRARLAAEALDAAAASRAELDRAEAAVLGKRSALTLAHRRLGSLEPAQRAAVGRRLHEARTELEALVAERRRTSTRPSAGRRWRPTGST